MSSKRVFIIIIGALSVLVAAFAGPAIIAAATGGYQQSSDQAQREQRLGERYGAVPQSLALREVALGERYGVVPEAAAAISSVQLQREYMLGERYGQTPAPFTQQPSWREYQLGERYGVMP